jgi:multisubunit Na+/H+ antiporter MnhE subunit
MNDILEIAAANQQRAREVIRDTDLEAIWRSVGAEANLVGSLRTGLLMKHRDIDFHIYSSPLRVADSFAAMLRSEIVTAAGGTVTLDIHYSGTLLMVK